MNKVYVYYVVETNILILVKLNTKPPKRLKYPEYDIHSWFTFEHIGEL